MKKLFVLALCGLFAAGAAEAKTYYVDASRPNNNGNGLKASTAKKTIQAAVNLAKDGDTIIVYPGEYAPFKTNNKKIAIKSAKGASKTKIVKTAKVQDIALAQLGKTWTESYVDTKGRKVTYVSAPRSKGKNTTLAGFLLDGKNRPNGGYTLLGISGGTVKSCSIQRLGTGEDGGYEVAVNATLAGCSVLNNHADIADSCVFSRCRILDNDGGRNEDSRFCNCLYAGNKGYGWWGHGAHFAGSVLVNCTIARNFAYRESSEDKVPFSSESKFYNCILRNNYRQTKTWEGKTGSATLHNTDSGNTYSRTYKDNRNPKFVKESSGDYKLAKGSPCINQGTVPAAIKSYVGSVDLAGAKRIHGASIDMGCYEY
ncbi:MAG: hypothetical protein IJS32_07345 [Kiritimatiellae bacterium]|nr:hypothetical protein [Kiritimatiellia bacterium]